MDWTVVETEALELLLAAAKQSIPWFLDYYWKAHPLQGRESKGELVFMNPSIFAVLIHLGKIIQTFKDVEEGIADVLAGKASQQDLNAILSDVGDLLASGLINIPSVSTQQLQQIAQQFKLVQVSPPAAPQALAQTQPAVAIPQPVV